MADVNIENVKIESDTSSAGYCHDEVENLSQVLSDSVAAKFGNSALGIKDMITNMRKAIVEDGANDFSDGYSVSERAQAGVVEAEIVPHVSQTHGVNEARDKYTKNHKCDQCPMSFSRRQHLQNHVRRRHLKLNEFTCELCEYKSCIKSEV